MGVILRRMGFRSAFLLLPMCLLANSGAAQTGAPADRVAPSAERWLLMGRHGECAPIATLRRKVPDLGEVNDPQAFAAFMRNKGFEVTATQQALPKGKYWELVVPAKELSLVFVTPELCQTGK